MAGFTQVAAGAKKPPKVVVLPPSIFKSDWDKRPTSEVAIGLRIPSDDEVSRARADAATVAWDYHPREQDVDGRIACMNDALLRELCAKSMCDPNNVAQPYFAGGMAQDDSVRIKMTTEGVKRVFDEIERLQIETSPVHREASDEEVVSLADAILTEGVFDAIPSYKAKRARRLIAYLLDELVATE